MSKIQNFEKNIEGFANHKTTKLVVQILVQIFMIFTTLSSWYYFLTSNLPLVSLSFWYMLIICLLTTLLVVYLIFRKFKAHYFMIWLIATWILL